MSATDVISSKLGASLTIKLNLDAGQVEVDNNTINIKLDPVRDVSDISLLNAYKGSNVKISSPQNELVEVTAVIYDVDKLSGFVILLPYKG